MPQADVVGVWEPALENALSIVGVHAVVLHTGKVLYWCFDYRAVGLLGKDNDTFVALFNNPELGSYQIWDPVSGTAGPVEQIGRNSFCAGQCALGDGTILVAGGQDGAGAIEIASLFPMLSSWFSALFGTDNGALIDLHTYDPVADVWTRWPDLQGGRYYPTCLILSDGTGFIAGGLSNLQQWVFSGGNWAENDQFETVPPRELFAGTTPQQKFRSADQYPIIRLLPGSQQLFVHIETTTYIFDLGSSSFVDGAQFVPPGVGRQTYPMQSGHVLLPQKQGDAPRILIVGGSTASNFDYNTQSDKPAVQLAFIFDYNAAAPTQSSWRTTLNPPNLARILADTVLLPDGTVFVVNGYSGGAAAGHTDRFAPVFGAEIFNPVGETFTTVAPNPDPMHPRGYHSTAVLLPDARVAIAGNTDAYNPNEPNQHDDVSIQIYDPPYLFAGPRPVVASVPAQVIYGSTIMVDASAGAPVASVMLMRPCAVTHSVDMDQRAIILSLSGGGANLSVAFPTDQSLAPPGYYMLFFVSAAGVPSVASFTQLLSGTPTYPPLNLGTYTGPCVIDEDFENLGDLTLDDVTQHVDLTLTSGHGSITINQKIDQHSYANLTAATGVSIGQKIDQLSIAEINAGGDVAIGQMIDAGSQATITAGGQIVIGQMVNQHSGATLTAATSVSIGQKVDQHSNVIIVAGTTVNIGQKIDQWSTALITAQGDIVIGQKLDQHTNSTITSLNGSITINQGMSGNCTATLKAPNGTITMNTIDSGCTLNWSAQSLNCPNQNGTITQIM
jgi:hypothetical protein